MFFFPTTVVFLHFLCFCLETCEAYSSNVFASAQHRPKLEILYPDNGLVLDNGELEIKIRVDGYNLPSNFHGSTICVGLSTGLSFAEQCFEQTSDLLFNVNGLSPGSQYALRIVLYERNQAIAVSVRNFRVAGIRGLLNSDDVVTIQTAVQVAMEYQLLGMEAQAELIYRSILSESPAYPDALHLLGVIFYQKGDALAAVPYIERALQSNQSFEGFHNSLGVCYRTLGRIDEAESQFRLAIALNPTYMSAVFNLGLTQQQLSRWDDAIDSYRQVNAAAVAFPDTVKPQMRLESAIRECDLLQGMQMITQALACWENGIELFPSDGVIRNEIGSIYVKANLWDRAASHFLVSVEQGYLPARLNLARVREMQGLHGEAHTLLQGALDHAVLHGLPSLHIRLLQATLQPKILTNLDHITLIRSSVNENLRVLLETAHDEVDNTQPTGLGLWTASSLLYHGLDTKISSLSIKKNLYRVYTAMCPVLLQGVFVARLFPIESNEVGQSRFLTTKDENFSINKTPILSNNTGRSVDDIDESSVGEIMLIESSPTLIERSGTDTVSSPLDATRPPDGADSSEVASSPPFPSASTRIPATKIRVGFASRFLYSHAVGRLVQGLAVLLSTNSDLEVVSFLIGGGSDSVQFDKVQQRISRNSFLVYNLPVDDISACATAIRSANIDVLVYPEVGIDITTYFLTFARLAPVQVAWMGHPASTGVQSIDYFLTSDVEVSDADEHYSESLYRMSYFGTSFIDEFIQTATLHRDSPRTILLNRARFTEDAHIPKAAHLYLVHAPLSSLHFSFDEVLRLVLQKDYLGFVVIVSDLEVHDNCKRQFFGRWSTHSVDIESRVLFVTPQSDEELSDLLSVVHVLLDPFPVTGEHYHVLLQALSMGLPVVTMPSSLLGGRLALGLYRLMDYGMHDSPGAAFSYNNDTDLPTNHNSDETASSARFVRESPSALVVHNIHDYVTMALRLTHQPKLRAHHSLNLLNRRHLLFGHDEATVLSEWQEFVHTALANSSSTSALNSI